jgi:hypothetical protein
MGGHFCVERSLPSAPLCLSPPPPACSLTGAAGGGGVFCVGLQRRTRESWRFRVYYVHYVHYVHNHNKPKLQRWLPSPQASNVDLECPSPRSAPGWNEGLDEGATNKRTNETKRRVLRTQKNAPSARALPLRGAARAEGAIIRGLVTNANAKYAPSIRGSQWDQWEHTDGGGEFERTNERTNCVPQGSNPGAGLGVPGRLGVVRRHQGVLFGCWPLSYERANDRALRSARRGYGGRAGCPSA